MGAWIEMLCIKALDWTACVAPLVGAWIEIDEYEQLFEEATVAPLVGAWIEIRLTAVVEI